MQPISEERNRRCRGRRKSRTAQPRSRLLAAARVCDLRHLWPALLLIASVGAGSVAADQADGVDTLLDRAAAALDGSTCVVDRRGDPASALDLVVRAGSAARAGHDRSALGRALAFEVRAATAAGQYSRARAAALEALQQPLDPARRAEVAGTLEWLRFLEGAQHPFVWKYDDELRVHQPVMPVVSPFAFAPTPSPAPSAISPFALAQLQIASATLALSRIDGRETERLLRQFPSVVVPACASGGACPWDLVFLGALQYAAGRADQAADRWSRAAAGFETGGDAVLAAITRIYEGDALAAPLSSPIELNLLVVNRTGSLLAMNAVRPTVELQPVEAERLARARQRYQRARALLRDQRCPRCVADLDLRDAYLAFASGDARDAARQFRAVSVRYRDLGDEVYAPLAAAAAAGALALAADLSGATATVEQLASDLARSGPIGAGIGAARLLGRVAFRLQYQARAPRAAERTLDLALLLADRTGLAQVGAELAVQKAELLIGLGRRHEGLLLTRRAREARQAYLAAVPTFTVLQRPNGVESELAIVRQELAVSSFSDAGVFLAEGDFGHAHEAIEMVRRIVQQGAAPLMQSNLMEMVEQAEVHLLLAQFRVDEALAASKTVADPMVRGVAHLHAGDDGAAAEIARRETVAAIDQLPQAAAGGPGPGDLRLQQLRSRIGRGIDLLITAHAAGDVQQLLALLRAKWPVPAADALDWLYGDPGRPWTRDLAEAAIAESLGDLADAESKLARARVAIARVAASFADPQAGEGFDADQAGADRSYVRVLAAQGRALDALRALEAARGRIYHQQLVAAGALDDTAEGTAALRSWWRAEAEVRALRLRALAGEPVTPAEVASAEAKTRQTRQRLENDFPVTSGLLARDDAVDRVVDEVRARLAGPAPTVLLAYFVSGDSTFVWVLSDRPDVVMRKLPISSRELRETTTTLYNRVATPQDNWQEPSRRLYEVLVRPIEDLLPQPGGAAGRPRLGILPHSLLNLVPFTALLGPGEAPLVQRFDVFYIPSLRTYARRTERPALRSAAVESFGFNGNALLHAEREAAAISESPHVHIGRDATRAAILDAAQRVPVLHLAAHARQDETNPFAARLFAADGTLTLAEMVGVPWRARLVTLSACGTAAGRLTAAEEFTGMSRGLLAAGVSTIVVTGWPIDDEMTAEIMRAFYTSLRAGADPVVALGDAQRAALARGGDAGHPGFWAPFMLVGAAR